ncbi:MAG: gliding motility-associated C-terminal domain-containing protein, partial [Bacteroidota bacterium]
NPTVTLLGTYALTVTGDNGCSTTTNTEVIQVDGISDLVLMADTINCDQPSTNLQATSAVPNLQYQWIGPDSFSSMESSPNVQVGGTYILTVTAASGCSAVESISVFADTIAPDLQVNDGLVNCLVSGDTLESMTMTSDVQYQWTGPNGFGSTQANPFVMEGGTYTLLLTASNGCTAAAEAQLVVDTLTPDLLLFADTIACTTPLATLSAVSSVDALQYQWTGPNSFSADTLDPQVATSGLYSLTITASNGCTNSETIQVVADGSIPIAEAGTADLLTCNQSMVQLSGAGSSVGGSFAYQWLDPNGILVGTDLQVSVGDSGLYQLIVTNIDGGCAETDVVQVLANTDHPEALIVPINGFTINCNFSSLVLNGLNSEPGGTLDFSWNQSGQVFSDLSEIEVSQVGVYALVVTDQGNGCQDTATVEIVKDTTLPSVSIQTPMLLTCFDPILNLDASNSSVGSIFTYQWSATNNGILSGDTTLFPMINTPGTYQLIVSNEQNGCIDSASVEVMANQVAPIAEAGPSATLDCAVNEVQLDGSPSSTGSPFAYLWTGPGQLIDAQSLFPTVFSGGIYTLVVTNQQNGCTAEDAVQILEDINAPNAADLDLTLPSCHGQNDGVIRIDSVLGGTEPFLFAFNEGPFNQYPQLNYLPSGLYPLTIQDALGCEWDTLINLPDPPELILDLGEDVAIELGDSLQLDAQTNLPFEQMDTLIWSPINYLNCTDCLDPFAMPLHEVRYTLTLVNPNGCTVQDQIKIDVNKRRLVFIPNVFSPDNNGVNDIFYIHGGKDVAQVMEFRIFDRWGEMIYTRELFSPNDPAYGWDGTLDGVALNPAVFIYYAKIKFIDGRVEEFSGDVTLIK